MPTPEQARDHSEIERLNGWIVEALAESGFGYLRPLIYPEKQAVFFRNIRAAGLDWLVGYNSDPRTPRIIKRSVEGGGVELRMIPPGEMKVVNGELGDSGLIGVTKVGRVVRAIERTYPQAAILAIDGLALEIGKDEKPRQKQRPMTTTQQYDFLRMRTDTEVCEWPMDGDFVILNCPTGSVEEIVCKTTRVERSKAQYHRVPLMEIRGTHSTKRPNFFAISAGVNTKRDGVRKKEFRSAAQFSFAEFEGVYDSRLGILAYVLSRADSPAPVLLVWTGERYGYMGIGVSFSPENRSYKQIRVELNRDNAPDFPLFVRYLSPVVYSDRAFPATNCEEAFYHLLHGLRTWTWDDSCPVVRGYASSREVLNTILTYPNVEKRYELDILTRNSALFFADLFEYFSTFGFQSEEIRIKFAQEFFDSWVGSIKGDPLIAILRSFPPDVDIKGISYEPLYGIGIISPKAVLRDLHDFLFCDDHGSRPFRLMLELAQCKPASKEGWERFAKFLYKETGNDYEQVSRLLTPYLENEQSRDRVEKHVRRSLSSLGFEPREGRSKRNFSPQGIYRIERM